MDLMRPENGGEEALFKAFWHHGDAIVCCAWKVGGDCDVCVVGYGDVHGRDLPSLRGFVLSGVAERGLGESRVVDGTW